MSAVGALCIISPHGVPVLIRCVGSAAPPQTELVGILNAVYQSVKQQVTPPRPLHFSHAHCGARLALRHAGGILTSVMWSLLRSLSTRPAMPAMEMMPAEGRTRPTH